LAQGTLSPGPGPGSPGLLTVGSVTFSPGTSFQVALNGTATGTGFSQLVSTGTVNLNNTTLLASLNFSPAVGDQFAIVQASGPITGFFTGSTGRVLQDGDFIAVNGLQFQIHYGTTASAAARRALLPVFSVFLVRSVAPTSITVSAAPDPAF